MTMQEFSRLTSQQQKVQLLTQGTFIDERSVGSFDIMLYELDGLYAEVFFLRSSNKLAFIRPLTATDELEPYLAGIDVKGLLQEAFS